MKETKANFRKLILPNGLTVLLYKMTDVRSVYAEVTIRAGAVYEPAGLLGISHFTEHASLLGTLKYKTKLDIARYAQSIGATHNGSTGRFATLYWVNVPFMNYSEGLNLLYDFVFNPYLDEAAILSDKKVVLSEFNDFWGDPESKFWIDFWRRRFKIIDHPYGRHALGESSDVKLFNKAKVVRWRNKYYHPNNMILTISGNFEYKDMVKLVKNLFGGVKRGRTNFDPVFTKTDYSAFDTYIQKDDRSQLFLGISFPTFGRDSTTKRQRMALGIIIEILIRGTGSRLFQRLRQKEGLVYWVGGSSTTYKYLGGFQINSSVSLENLTKVFKSIYDEIKILLKDGITNSELVLAKKFISYSTLLEFDNPSNIAQYLTDREFDDGEIWFPERYEAEATKITKDEVNLMAKQIFDFSKVNIGIMGNISSKIIKEIELIYKKG